MRRINILEMNNCDLATEEKKCFLKKYSNNTSHVVYRCVNLQVWKQVIFYTGYIFVIIKIAIRVFSYLVSYNLIFHIYTYI